MGSAFIFGSLSNQPNHSKLKIRQFWIALLFFRCESKIP